MFCARGGSPSMSPVSPDALDSSWRMATVGIFHVWYRGRVGPHSEPKCPGVGQRREGDGDIAGGVRDGITVRSAVPAKVSGCAGPRRSVAELCTSRWQLTNQCGSLVEVGPGGSHRMKASAPRLACGKGDGGRSHPGQVRVLWLPACCRSRRAAGLGASILPVIRAMTVRGKNRWPSARKRVRRPGMTVIASWSKPRRPARTTSAGSAVRR